MIQMNLNFKRTNSKTKLILTILDLVNFTLAKLIQ